MVNLVRNTFIIQTKNHNFIEELQENCKFLQNIVNFVKLSHKEHSFCQRIMKKQNSIRVVEKTFSLKGSQKKHTNLAKF